MSKNMAAIGIAILLIALGNGVSGEGALATEPAVMPSPVQVIAPQIEILDRPVIIEVQADPSLGADTSMRILCATSAYRGEVHEERQDARISLSISGEIRELSPGSLLVSFDVEARIQDVNGGKGLACSGAAIFQPPKPKTILTIGGRSVILTVRFAPEETE